MPMTVDTLRHATKKILAALDGEHENLTALDGKIGDGDLGITLLKAFRELDRLKADWSDDLGQALMQGASAVSKVSSSSFGTLLATSMMSVAKQTRGKTEASWTEMPGWLDGAVAAMMARGKASLGDKTVLDAVTGAAKAMAGQSEPGPMLAAAKTGVDEALTEFHDKPNRIGRARIFGDRTIGMDDPGMVAFKVMVEGL